VGGLVARASCECAKAVGSAGRLCASLQRWAKLDEAAARSEAGCSAIWCYLGAAALTPAAFVRQELADSAFVGGAYAAMDAARRAWKPLRDDALRPTPCQVFWRAPTVGRALAGIFEGGGAQRRMTLGEQPVQADARLAPFPYLADKPPAHPDAMAQALYLAAGPVSAFAQPRMPGPPRAAFWLRPLALRQRGAGGN